MTWLSVMVLHTWAVIDARGWNKDYRKEARLPPLA